MINSFQVFQHFISVALDVLSKSPACPETENLRELIMTDTQGFFFRFSHPNFQPKTDLEYAIVNAAKA